MRPASALLLLATLALAGCADDGSSEGNPGDAGASGTSTSSGSQTAAPTARPPETHESVMRNNRFVPADLTVRVGDTVHWTTEDPQAHNVVSETPGSEFRSPDVSTIPALYAQEFSYTFTKEGSVDYVCEYHAGMVGTVTVVPSNGTMG